MTGFGDSAAGPPATSSDSRPSRTVAQLSLEATRLSANRSHRAAIDAQTEAVRLCRQDLEELLADESVIPNVSIAAARTLADHCGRLGGIYRRADLLRQAVRHYGEGADLERTWMLEDTYNRTNHLVVAVLLNPARVPSLGPQIDEVAATVRRQVDRGRRNEWWAWADLALLNLLGGHMGEALWAYHRFTGTGPRPRDYESSIAVLRDIRVALTGVRWERSATLVGDVSGAMEYLRGRRDELVWRRDRERFKPSVWLRCLQADLGPAVTELDRRLALRLGRNRVHLDVVEAPEDESDDVRWERAGTSVRAVVVVEQRDPDAAVDTIRAKAEASLIPVVTLSLRGDGPSSPDILVITDNAADIENAVQRLVEFEPELLLPTVLQSRPTMSADMLDLIRRSAEPRSRLPQPSVLLRPEYGIVAFAGRADELAALGQWLEGPSTVSLQLIAAPGGIGKTRLAQELVEISQGWGWSAGFLAENADLSEVGQHRSRLLVVVDYAEARTDQIAELLLARSAGSEPLRVLLLARSQGLWLRRLREHPDDRVRGPALALGHVTLKESLGGDEYERARSAFAALLDIPMTDAGSSAPLVDPSRSALDVHAAALAAVLAVDGGSSPSNGPLRQALHHERRYWARTLREYGLGAHLDAADQIVAVTSLGGSAGGRALAQMLRRLPVLTNARQEDLDRWRSWLTALYPGRDGFAGLQPDRLAEELVADVVEGTDGLVSAIAPALDEQQFARAFAVFSRAAGRRPAFGQAMRDLLTADPVRAISIAMTLATRAETPITSLLDALAGSTASIINPTRAEGDINVVLATFAAARSRAALKHAEEIGETDSIVSLTHQLARRLVAAEQPGESLNQANAAAERLRSLDDGNAVRSELAAVLVTAAKAYDRLRQPGYGMSALDEAIGIARGVDDRIVTDALLVRSKLRSGQDDHDDALRDAEEAVVMRRSADDGDADTRDRLAAALERYGSALVKAGRAAEAVMALREATEELGVLDALEPSWFRSDLIRVLVALGDVQEHVEPSEAVRTIDLAVSLGRSLLDRYGGAYSEPLLNALQYAADLQERRGDHGAAASLRAEIADVTRRMSDERPELAAITRLAILRGEVAAAPAGVPSGVADDIRVLADTLRRMVESGRNDLATIHADVLALLTQAARHPATGDSAG